AGLYHAGGLSVSRTVGACHVVPDTASPARGQCMLAPRAGPPSRGTPLLHSLANTQGRAESSTVSMSGTMNCCGASSRAWVDCRDAIAVLASITVARNDLDGSSFVRSRKSPVGFIQLALFQVAKSGREKSLRVSQSIVSGSSGITVALSGCPKTSLAVS